MLKIKSLFAFISMVSFCQVGIADYSCYTTTPKGTKVYGSCMTYELSSAEISSMNSYVSQNYPLATKETNASRKYNCHSYAWYNQGITNSLWINSPEEDKYWNDGSYILKYTGYNDFPQNNVANGAKVSYIYDDHSAIKVGSY